VAEAAKEDDAFPREDEEDYRKLIENEDDHFDFDDDDSDDELSEEPADHAWLLIATPSEIESPKSAEYAPIAPIPQPKRLPCSAANELEKRQQDEQEA
jgi:hypothetical protein